MTDARESSDSNDSREAEDLDNLRRQLATSDPAVVIANHCYGLFELAAVYLSEQPPRLTEAQVAIDALGNLLIADTGNNRIRRVGPDGVITTIAGDGAAAFAGDGGDPANASLNAPAAVAASSTK